MIDITNQKFGKLTAVSFAKKTASGRTFWLCRCDCGTEVVIRTDNLRSRHTTSCGKCRSRKEPNKKRRDRLPIKYYKLEYKSWEMMIQRCTNPNYTAYKSYGGRGITVCERWLTSFNNFYTDMGSRPNKDYSLDRINNNGNYEPGNCRWATRSQQSANQRPRNNVVVHLDGEILTVKQVSQKLGIPRHAAYDLYVKRPRKAKAKQ